MFTSLLLAKTPGRFLASLAFGLAFSGTIRAEAPLSTGHDVVVCCPETAQTYADSTVLQRQLSWRPDSQRLVASISFSNADYVSDTEPRHIETFAFSLPGVKFDPKTEVFFITSSQGSRIPVAALHRQFIGKAIQLLPGASLDVAEHGGFVTVRLVAGQKPVEQRF